MSVFRKRHTILSVTSESIPTSPAGEIVLVDEHDQPIGVADKLAPHQNGGRLHRAFSVFVFNAAGQMLLQQRAPGKYHFARLWTNACCSHPRPGKDVAAEAAARLHYEMGIDVALNPLFTFIYRADDPVSGLTEHELDHVFVGRFQGAPRPIAVEVMDWKWVDPQSVQADVAAHPAQYTPWFKIVLERVIVAIPR
jgi:isopentenyl-diphosphate delta-isomerase